MLTWGQPTAIGLREEGRERKKLRERLSFANALSVIAVFIAFGGAAYAATQLPKNSVGPKQLKKDAVTTAKIRNEAVTGAKVKKGTLTGAQINASMLAKVPGATQTDSATQAAHAGSADAVGNGARRIDYLSEAVDSAPPASPSSPAAHQLLALGGLTVSASCVKEGSFEAWTYVSMSSSAHAEISWGSIRFQNPGAVAFSDGTTIGPGANPSYGVSSVKGGNRSEIGQWVDRSATEATTASLSIVSNENDCQVIGTAVRAKS